MGVYTRKTKFGIPRYYIRYYANGKLIREVTPARTLKQAEFFLAKRRVEVEEGKWVDRKDIKRFRFHEYADEYLELKHLQGLKSIDRVELSLRILKEYFGDIYIDGITGKDIYRYISKRKLAKSERPPHNPLAPATINRELACLRNLLKEARKNGLIESDPMFGISLLKEDNIRNRCLTEDEEQRLMKAAPDHLYGTILFALETGARRGEILSLTWDQVDLQKNIIFLRGADTKTGVSRKIPISHRLHEYLYQLPRSMNHDHVFLYRDNPIGDIKNSWNNTRRKAKLDDFRFHDLRHTFVTRKRREGIHDHVIMAITGHKTREMFSRYDVIEEDDLRNAVNNNGANSGNGENGKSFSKTKIGDTPGDTSKNRKMTPTRK